MFTMDYPDENEEFELQYQEELELMEEMQEEESNYRPIPKVNEKNNLQNSTVVHSQSNTPQSLFSTQLSQISYGDMNNDDPNTDGQLVGVGGSVNRRLFGTPKGPQRGASTPAPKVSGLAPIQEVIDLGLASESTDRFIGNSALRELNAIDIRNKRRLERDLFGDIDDLYQNETYDDPVVKKARTEEQRDMEMIEKILEARKRHIESTNTYRCKDQLERLKALHDYKMRNLSHSAPKWPFILLRRSDHDRIFVRFHSTEYETNALNELKVVPTATSLLGERKEQVWASASEIVLKRLSSSEGIIPSSTATTSAAAAATATATAIADIANSDVLWVEKYKPRKYIDLLSDESTNRSLLYWLKMWDKIVFGKEFKTKQEEIPASKLNTFNKRTGRFESNGGWQKRKVRQALNTNVDELGRPIQKVALLCGPPGLGKTTLAHTIARHAGYVVREINASDDRTPEAFKLALENGTQMSSVLNEDLRPNCIILDEIDGAPKQSIEYLIKFVSDNVVNKVKTKGAKAQHNVLKRPIICICNDLYDPALRPLRQIAFVVTFPPIDSARLADRLLQIARVERIKTDYGSLIALAEKSGNDVRSCISTMEFFNAQKKALTLSDVLNNNLGHKDRHQGLFEIWRAIFSIKRPKKQLERRGDDVSESHITMTDMSLSTRVHNVLDAVHSDGDYARLAQGVYENFLQQKMPDPNMNGVTEALQWFGFSDHLHRQINQLQNYTVYPYLQYSFVAWHLLFASLAWPKINFPTRGYEFHQKANTQRSIFQCLRRGITSGAVGVGQGVALLLDTVPLVKRILSPTLRSVAVQLLSQKEQYDLRHVVEVMVDLGLKYIQVKSTESAYVFQTEPDIETLAQFPGFPGITLTYFGRQLIAREVELELVRRATPRSDPQSMQQQKRDQRQQHQQQKNATTTKQIPNHLRTLQPMRIQSTVNSTAAKEVVKKDFFGRIQQTSAAAIKAIESKKDPIVKSPIWYRYKEGFNNAVRKDIHLNELL